MSLILAVLIGLCSGDNYCRLYNPISPIEENFYAEVYVHTTNTYNYATMKGCVKISKDGSLKWLPPITSSKKYIHYDYSCKKYLQQGAN